MKTRKHPMQYIHRASDGVIRFVGNDIIQWLFAEGHIDLNKIATLKFSREDHMQLAQLIGYSVSGFGDLSYATKAEIEAADEIADQYVRNLGEGDIFKRLIKRPNNV